MWKRTTGQELEATTGGKPTKLTYEYAERLLLAQANHPEILPPGSHEIQKLGCTFMVSLNVIHLVAPRCLLAPRAGLSVAFPYMRVRADWRQPRE